MVIDQVISWLTAIIGDYLYPGVFLAALIETVFPPIPSELVFPLTGYIIFENQMGIFHVFGAGIAGGAGATVGSFVIYYIALKMGRPVIVRYAAKIRISEKKILDAEKWFAKYGDKSVLIGRLIPGIRSLVSIPAGILDMPPVKFTLYTFAGSTAWSTTFVFLGYYFGTFELF